MSEHVLEPAAQAFAEAAAQPPLPYERGTVTTTAALTQATHVLREALAVGDPS